MLVIYLEGSGNVGREIETWYQGGKAADKRCVKKKTATTVGNWGLILQRYSKQLYKIYASDLSLLGIKGAGIFMAQLPSVTD